MMPRFPAARLLLRVSIVVAIATAAAAGAAAAATRVGRVIDVAPVWSGHPVGFSLLTRGQTQLVAFYDAQRRMTIGSRALDSDRWTFHVLPTSVGWDSHNSIEMTVDDDGQIHVVGNMHASPLIYFRTTRPMDITSFEKVGAMVGRDEQRATYPSFLRGPAGELIFTYRDGSSGNGNQIYDLYDPKARTWARLLDRPLTDGEGLMNAYFQGPTRGPDGFFHLVWVWRDTPACETNHDLCYARSRDLRRWETSGGKPLALPIKLATAEVIDPVPPKGGIINGNTILGFDAQKRPVVAYHKYDVAGNTQVYNARLEDGRWVIHQTSDWHWRWDFSGGGSIPFEVHLGPVRAGRDGTLTQWFATAKHGSGVCTLDPATLKPTATNARPPAHPAELEKVQSGVPGMQVRWSGDRGKSPAPGVRYELRWETLGANRDRPRPKPWPAPTMLRVYAFPDK
jgi:hypothetical protein